MKKIYYVTNLYGDKMDIGKPFNQPKSVDKKYSNEDKDLLNILEDSEISNQDLVNHFEINNL